MIPHSVVHLNLAYCPHIRGRLQSLQNCEHLESLMLEGCSMIEGGITPSLVDWLSGLAVKNLNSCGRLVLTGDLSEVSTTVVDLSHMSSLEGQIGDFETLPASVTSLNLAGCWKISGAKGGLRSALPHCKITM